MHVTFYPSSKLVLSPSIYIFFRPLCDYPIAMFGCRSVKNGNIVSAHLAYIGAVGDHEPGYCETAGEDPASPGL